MTYAEAVSGWPRETCPCGMEVVWEVQRTFPGEAEYRWQALRYVGPYDLETGELHAEFMRHTTEARKRPVSVQRAVAVIPEAEDLKGPVRRQQPPSEPSREPRTGEMPA